MFTAKWGVGGQLICPFSRPLRFLFGLTAASERADPPPGCVFGASLLLRFKHIFHRERERARPVRSGTTRKTANDKWHSWLGFCLRRPLFCLGSLRLFLRHGFIPQTKVRCGITVEPVYFEFTSCVRRTPVSHSPVAYALPDSCKDLHHSTRSDNTNNNHLRNYIV